MYQLKLHKNLAGEKWQSFTKTQQILMIANELNRLLNGLNRRTIAELRECLERTMELLDLAISTHKNTTRAELLRFRDLIAALYLLDQDQLNHSEATIKSLLRVLLFSDSASAKINKARR